MATEASAPVADLLLDLGLVVATIVAHCAVVRGLARSVVLVEDADDVVGKAVFAAIAPRIAGAQLYATRGVAF